MILPGYPIFAYLLGSISSAIIVCKSLGLPDPRTIGSNNPGATNVFRVAGRKVAATVLLLDMLKGFLIVSISRYWLNFYAEELAVLALAGFLGQIWPIFHNFEGGKGIAISLGLLLGLSWPLALLGLIIWCAIFFITKISSLASLSALISVLSSVWYKQELPISVVITIMCVIITLRHRNNISNLIFGKEGKLIK